MNASDSDPAKVTLFNHVSGDTWPGIDVGPIMVDGGDDPDYPMENSVERVDLFFRKKGSDNIAIKFSTVVPEEQGDIIVNPIEIVDAVNWVIKVLPCSPEAFPLKPGTYIGHFQTIDSEDIKRTLYEITITVTKDLTSE